MDHTHISGTEPSPVILSQKCNFQKLKRDVPNVPKQAETKRDGVINRQNYNFKQFFTENVDALKRYESPEKHTSRERGGGVGGLPQKILRKMVQNRANLNNSHRHFVQNVYSCHISGHHLEIMYNLVANIYYITI